MQACSAVVVSVSRQGLASSGFSGRSTHTAFEGPDLGTRYLFNREIGLIKYDHQEEFIGSWHEVEHHWRHDDGYGNGVPITGACAGHIRKKLLPKCATESVVHDGNVHHFYCGVGITLDVEQNYMTIWHDHLGLVVHFGEDLYTKFQPLQPVNIKCQPCAEHRFYGFHATRVTSAASIRLKYLYFAVNAEVEIYDNFLVAKCSNDHRVVLLDKTRALIRPGEMEGCGVGDKLNLAYYRIHTAHGPIYISAFVTNEHYFDEHFEHLCNTRSMREHLHENLHGAKSEVDMLSPARLKTFCQQSFDCWNVDNEDVSWYTNRFCPDTATSVAPSRTTQREEVEEAVETSEEHHRQPVVQEQIQQSEEAMPRDESEFSDSVFLPEEPSSAESTVGAGSDVEEAPVAEEKLVEREEATDQDRGDFNQKLEFDEDHGIDLDLGKDDDALSKYDDGEAEEQAPVVAEAVLPSENKENLPITAEGEENDTILTTHLHDLDEKCSIAFSMDLFLVAEWRVFQALTREEMAMSFEMGHKRRTEIAIKNFVTEAMKPRDRDYQRKPSWTQPRGGENMAPTPNTPTNDSRPRTQPVAAVRPIIGLPLGQGAQIPQGMMKQPQPTTAPPPPSSLNSQQPGPSTSTNRRIGIVPRRDSHSAVSESGGSSNHGHNRPNNTNRSVSPMPANSYYLDLGPMLDGEDANDYLERVMNEMDTNESKPTRWILSQIVASDAIQNKLRSCFPALHEILKKMFSQPNVVALSCLDALVPERTDTTGNAALDRILMETAVLELLKTKSRTIRDFIVETLPYIEEMM